MISGSIDIPKTITFPVKRSLLFEFLMSPQTEVRRENKLSLKTIIHSDDVP